MVYMPYAENVLEDFYPMSLLFKLACPNLGMLEAIRRKRGGIRSKKKTAGLPFE
jgi:hypothetical protein